MVFDNLVLNLKSFVTSNKHSNDDDIHVDPNRKPTLNPFLYFRTYLNDRYAAVSGQSDDIYDNDLMFPRVFSSTTAYDYGNCGLDTVDLIAPVTVVDKFTRVIKANGQSSPTSIQRILRVGIVHMNIFRPYNSVWIHRDVMTIAGFFFYCFRNAMIARKFVGA